MNKNSKQRLARAAQEARARPRRSLLERMTAAEARRARTVAQEAALAVIG